LQRKIRSVTVDGVAHETFDVRRADEWIEFTSPARVQQAGSRRR